MNWIYDEEPVKLQLIQDAMVKAKEKAEEMVSSVGYKIAGIRTCSDSYEIPNQNITVR